MRWLLPIFLMLTTLSSARGQITLQGYRDSVYRASTEIANSMVEVERAVATVKSSYADFLPSVSADGSFMKSFRRSGDDKLWSFSVTPTLSQTIYSGGGVRAAWRRAKCDYEYRQEDARSIRLQMRYMADYAYWQVSAMQLYMSATNRYVDIVRSLCGVVQARYKEGYVAKGDLLQVEARLSEAEYSRIAVRTDYENALHRFNNLAGWHEPSEHRLAQSITDTLSMPQRVSFAEIAERRPDVRAMEWMARAAEYGVDVVRASYNPNIYASIGGSWQTFSPNTTGDTYLDAAVMVGVTIPIFQWGKRRYEVAAARSEARINYNLWEQVRDDIEQEEADGWSRLTGSYSQMQSSLRNLDIAGENLSISTLSYQEGRATILEVLQAQISWIQIYTNAITARFNYAVAVSEYMRLTAAD